MCREVIGVALCAPAQKPTLSFTCSDLHLVAVERYVCPDSKGSCVCFFGTCGNIEKVVGLGGFDPTALPKVRCAACTVREDDTGDRRHGRVLLESPLLTRQAVREDELKSYMTTLRHLWGDKDQCPFHLNRPQTPNGDQRKTSDDGANGKDLASPSSRKNVNGVNGDERCISAEAKSTEGGGGSNTKNENDPSKPPSSAGDAGSPKANEATLKPSLGIETSRWAPSGKATAESSPPASNNMRKSPSRTAPELQVPAAPRAPSRTVEKVASMKAFLRMA